MFRWYILRTLIYKEILRYRYNWGLLVMVFALLALTALVSIGARLKKLPGVGGTALDECRVFYKADSWSFEWATHLSRHRPPSGEKVTFLLYGEGRDPRRLPPDRMAIELTAPDHQPGSAAMRPSGPWEARYCYPPDSSTGILPYRDWFVGETQKFLGSRPYLQETSLEVATESGDSGDRIPWIVTALVIFSLYLLSFNLYITSTGEEREKRVLLGLLLSPATPTEIVAAKAIFYAVTSLLLSLAVACMYQPRLLGNPYLWSSIVLGSVGYVAIGTIVISIVRRQTTISTVSMLYLIGTSIIMFLAQLIPLPFGLLRWGLMENYLYGQLRLIISDQPAGRNPLDQVMLAGIVGIWSVSAVFLFERQGMSISRSR